MVTKDKQDEGMNVSLTIPISDPKLFRHKTTDRILHILSDNPYTEYTLRRLAHLTRFSSIIDLSERGFLHTQYKIQKYIYYMFNLRVEVMGDIWAYYQVMMIRKRV